jgi:hypothetical protein
MRGAQTSVRAMIDDNIIGIDGRQAGELRKDQAEREQREQTLRQKLKCEGLELRPGNAPGTYTMRTRTLRSHRTLMGGATYRWIKSKMPRLTLTSVRIHGALISMMARSSNRSNQRPDTLMQDCIPPDRRTPLATHGRTIHQGHFRSSVPTDSRALLRLVFLSKLTRAGSRRARQSRIRKPYHGLMSTPGRRLRAWIPRAATRAESPGSAWSRHRHRPNH